MMNKHAQTYFTTGEFAALCGVTKHTLFHYDQLGIFSPAYKQENGYRFYSFAQIEVFHVISTLKELDIPLKEIKAYLDRRSPEELVRLLMEEEQQIARRMEQLRRMRELIREKRLLTQDALRVRPDRIHRRQLPKELLVATAVESLTSERGIALAVAAHVRYCTRHNVYSPHPIGGMISLEMVRQGSFESYSHFYTRVASPPAGLPVVEKPAGAYLTAYHAGGYATVPEAYRRLLRHADRRRIPLCGPFYEDVLLDELSMKGYEHYLLGISILIGGGGEETENTN